jgi:DNA polymerase V
MLDQVRACPFVGFANMTVYTLTSSPPEDVYQGNFLDTRDRARSKTLMATIDSINHRMGRNSVFYAASGIHRPWAMSAKMRSPHFTTDWEQLLINA